MRMQNIRCSPVLFCITAVYPPWVSRGSCSVLSVEALQSGLSAPVKLSDSGRSGSRAGQGLESAATLPVSPHEHDSASDMADPGGAGKLQSLPHL